jgi:hypothetical protein
MEIHRSTSSPAQTFILPCRVFRYQGGVRLEKADQPLRAAAAYREAVKHYPNHTLALERLAALL